MKRLLILAISLFTCVAMSGCGGGGGGGSAPSSIPVGNVVTSVSPNSVPQSQATPITITITGVFNEPGSTGFNNGFGWNFYKNGLNAGQGETGNWTFTVNSPTQATLVIKNPNTSQFPKGTYDIVIFHDTDVGTVDSSPINTSDQFSLT